MYNPYSIDGKLFVPDWCYEDCPVDGDKVEGGYLSNSSPEKYRDKRRSVYFACNWLPKLKVSGIPFIPSDLMEVKDLNFSGKKFVRTCRSSPKDISNCIFDSRDQALYTMGKSKRTNHIFSGDHQHILVREPINIDIECRCFIHKHKLRAVSIYQWLDDEPPSKGGDVKSELKEFKDLVYDFFAKYGELLPYNSAVMELCQVKGENGLRVVEFNSFGLDQYSGGSEFDWVLDKEILYNSSEPEWRMPGQFEF